MLAAKCNSLINPRFEHQQFHRLSTTRRPRPAATHLTGSNQKAHAIPDDRSARIFRVPVCRGCNAVDRRRSLGQPSTLPEPAADRGLLRPSFSKPPAARTAKTSRTPTLDFPAAQRRSTCVATASCLVGPTDVSPAESPVSLSNHPNRNGFPGLTATRQISMFAPSSRSASFTKSCSPTETPPLMMRT